MILEDRAAEQADDVAAPDGDASPPTYRRLLSLRQTWGTIASRALTDPV
jgi:hypothetical protein